MMLNVLTAKFQVITEELTQEDWHFIFYFTLCFHFKNTAA